MTTITPPRPVAAQPAAAADPRRELCENLAELHARLKDLLALAEQKLAATRTADWEGLRGCAARELDVLEAVGGVAQQRTAILARLAQALPWPGARSASLTALAERVGEPYASQIRARALALREVSGKLQRKNEVVSLVARELQGHIREVFAVLAKSTRQTVGYGAQGQEQAATTRAWVDAVG